MNDFEYWSYFTISLNLSQAFYSDLNIDASFESSFANSSSRTVKEVKNLAKKQLIY